MRRALLLLAAALVLAACSTGRRLDALEARAAAAEAAQAQIQHQLDQLTTRLDALLGHLRRQARADGDADAQVERLLRQIAELEAELHRVVANKPPSPPRQRRPEPDPADVYAVPIDNSPVDGPADALVTIVRGYEYACPYCEKSRATMAELRRLYPDDVRIVYRQFIVHPQTATEPARAACAAHLQGKFFEMDALLWDKAYAQRKFDTSTMEQLAVEIGLDLDQFRLDVAGPCQTIVADDQADLTKVGQGATPTFFINGRYLAGAQPVASFQKIVDEELALATQRLGKVKGKKRKKARARYYKTWILDKGKPEFDRYAP